MVARDGCVVSECEDESEAGSDDGDEKKKDSASGRRDAALYTRREHILARSLQTAPARAEKTFRSPNRPRPSATSPCPRSRPHVRQVQPSLCVHKGRVICGLDATPPLLHLTMPTLHDVTSAERKREGEGFPPYPTPLHPLERSCRTSSCPRIGGDGCGVCRRRHCRH
jgi:hypothetical protein